MKKTFLITGVIALFSTLAITTSAQETPVKETTTQENWDAKKNSTVDSIMSQYKDKYVAAKPAQTIAHFFLHLANMNQLQMQKHLNFLLQSTPIIKDLCGLKVCHKVE